MTALREYQRLEAQGLWRAAPDAQARDVIVSVGEATLTLSDMQERPLAHWSLAAVACSNPGQCPALYHPDGDPGETLELSADEAQMIAAIERLRSAIDRRRPHPGRLRLALLLAVLAGALLVVSLWLPGVVRRHAMAVLPEVTKADIGADLLARIEDATGPSCRDPDGVAALARLAQRLVPAGAEPPRLVVLRDMPEGSGRRALPLPGGTIALDRRLLEDHDAPDVAAGHVVAARLRAIERPPLETLLGSAGLLATLRLLATGRLPDETLDAHAAALLTATPLPPSDAALLAAFGRIGLRARPYADARDITGESVLGLIEADPFAPPAAMPSPLLSDADWLPLQAICGG